MREEASVAAAMYVSQWLMAITVAVIIQQNYRAMTEPVTVVRDNNKNK